MHVTQDAHHGVSPTETLNTAWVDLQCESKNPPGVIWIFSFFHRR